MNLKARLKTIALDARPLSMEHTGTAFYIRSIISALLKANFKITLVSNRKIKSTDNNIRKCEKVILPGSSRLQWEQIKLLNFLKKQKPDVYIATWNYGLPWAYRGKTKFLLCVLDVIPAKMPNIYLVSIIDKLRYFLSMKIAIHKANNIITISKTSARDFRKVFPNHQIKPILINLNLIPPVKSNSKLGDYFVYLGGVDPRKNIDKLLRAYAVFSRLDNHKIKLILIGRGFEIFDELIKQLRIDRMIVKTGYVSDEQKLRILVNAKALIYPSSMEGYGLPVAEAIACDIPVVTSNNATMKEIAGGAALFVNPRNIESMISAMTLILENSTIAKLKSARRNQIKKINDDSIDKQIVGIIRGL